MYGYLKNYIIYKLPEIKVRYKIHVYILHTNGYNKIKYSFLHILLRCKLCNDILVIVLYSYVQKINLEWWIYASNDREIEK